MHDLGESMAESQSKYLMKEALRQVIIEKCQENYVVEVARILKSVGADCLSEAASGDYMQLLTLLCRLGEED